MKSNVRITKGSRFSELILMPEDIRELAEILLEEYDQDIEKGDDACVQFFLEDAYHTQYESKDPKAFSKQRTFESKRITSVKMNFLNFDENKRISIDLKHRQSVEIVASGKDERWVHGVLELIEICLSNCRKPETWPHKFRWPLTILFDFGIGLLIINSLEIILPWEIADFSSLYSTFPFNLYLPFALGFIPASIIVDRIRRLYPRVELITGPEHTRTEERKRKSLHKLISLGITPLVISVLIELIKAFLLS